MAKKYVKITFGSAQELPLREKFSKFLGFTASGRSTLGTVVRKEIGKRNVRRVSGAVLVILGLTLLIYPATRNIGGVFAINLEPSPTIDVTTLPSVQTPIDYRYESRGFSWYHAGVDLVAPTGTKVHPIMPGIVQESPGDQFGYGNYVTVTHDQGYSSIYAHLSEIDVKAGDKVSLNTVLGKSGSTGRSTGPHVHLEVYYQGKTINPAEIVPEVK